MRKTLIFLVVVVIVIVTVVLVMTRYATAPGNTPVLTSPSVQQ